MKIQRHRIDTNVVVGLLVREFCCSGTDVSAKVLAMYAGTRTPSMEPQWLAAGLSQHPNHSKGIVRFQYAVTYTATIFHCCAILPHFFCSCKCFFLFFFDLRYFPCLAHFLLESFQFFYKTARCHSIFIFKCPMKIRQIVKAYRQGDFQNRCIALLK